MQQNRIKGVQEYVRLYNEDDPLRIVQKVKI